ncbi:MAG TPA: patatin-like phospholipase family protein [Candidatus Angelobacter sp.]
MRSILFERIKPPSRCTIRASLITFFTVVLFVTGFSQTASTPPHPKVGLVLEGGGALGLAHIGVIQWLEEHHVPVSYVSGTSMGGLVGGLYATGHSAPEIKELIKTIDWDAVLQGQTPYKNFSFRRKQDAAEYPNRLEFGLKKGLQFPEGFNSGQEVMMILDRVALPYSEIKNFNDLPTPFACVSTDLVTNQPFVFRQGSLSLALRSTMSLPGIFDPVRWNGHIFADGGLMDNLPVDVAKTMGADLTIAVHLETAKVDPKASMSSFGVMGRSISVVIAANELRSMEKADMLISVPLAKFGSMQYNRVEELIKDGYAAAEAKAALLNTLSVDEPTWQAYLAERAARRLTAPTPEFVQVTGTSKTLAKAIENDLKKNVGKPVETPALQEQLFDLKGEGRFSSFSYQMTNRDNKSGLLVTATEKPYSPPVVQPLLLLGGSNFSGVDFSAGARITFLDFGSYRTELRNDVIIGSQYGIYSQYYRPLSTTSKWFIAPEGFANYQQYPIYRSNVFLAQYRKTSVGGGLQVGHEFGRVAQLSLGYTGAQQSLAPRIGNESLLPTVSGRFGATKLRFALNQVDNPVIPRTGEYMDLSTSWVDANPGAAHSFPTSEGSLLKFIKLNAPSSVYFGARGGTTFGNQLVGVPLFSLGGPNTFAAYGENELLTDQYYQFQAGYLRKITKLPVLLGDGLYFNTTLEVGRVFSPPFESQTPGDAIVALIANTIFGPIEFGGAVGTAGHQRVFFKLGRIF